MLTALHYATTTNSFTGVVKLKSIRIAGGPGGQCPSRLKVWINRNDIDFSNADDLPATQEWELSEDLLGDIPWPTKYVVIELELVPTRDG
jgi:hypothetical protein